VLAGLLVYPWEQARAALRASRELIAGAPDELTLFDVLLTAPPQAPFPPELQGRRVAVVGFAWCGDLAAGEQVLARMRAACAPALDLVGPMPYTALQTMLDATAPHGWNFYDKLHYLPEVGDDFVATLLEGFAQVPEPEAHVVTGWLGGAVGRVRAGETAFGHRDAGAFTWIIGSSGPRPLEPTIDWVRDMWSATEPFSTGGVYVNALDAGRSVRDAYADGVWERLVEVKRRYDPDGVFTGNGIS
jgi:FAD/FMN-containing dehydrogenase